jgi:magnesium transporter
MKHASREFMILRRDWSVARALEEVRTRQVPGPVLYFYVVDDDERLIGVLPARALLVSSLDTPVESLMVKKLVKLPSTATISDASELFVMHRFLAIPIVDEQQRVIGVIDVSAFSDEVLDLAERRNVETLFEQIGFRVTEARDASPLRAFRLRFPWLTATLAGGTACALLAGVYGATLEQSLVLAFFLTLVLGLGESVSTQSMTMAVQLLRKQRPTLAWFLRASRREFFTATMLGLACGAATAGIVMLWRGDGTAALAIGGSISIAMVLASMLGLIVPSVLHALRLDPRVASGPVTLAMADLGTLGVYFNVARVLL